MRAYLTCHFILVKLAPLLISTHANGAPDVVSSRSSFCSLAPSDSKFEFKHDLNRDIAEKVHAQMLVDANKDIAFAQ